MIGDALKLHVVLWHTMIFIDNLWQYGDSAYLTVKLFFYICNQLGLHAAVLQSKPLQFEHSN